MPRPDSTPRSPPLVVALAFFALLVPTLGQAQTPPVKPGLWEIRSEGATDGVKSAPPADRMKNLPPAVRAKMEAMLKEKGLAVGTDGAHRACLTRETMDPARWQGRTGCKTDYLARSSSAWKWHTVCTQPASVTDGEAVFANAENYTVDTSLTMTLRGETKTTRRTVKAKWLGADCGDLKPLDLKR
ncbi:MAG: DUF3617 domain-containing protein [Caldimonas sp.]